MQKEIRYNQLTTLLSPYDAAEGDLDVAINLIPEDGNLRPVLPPVARLQLPEGYRLLCTHNIADNTTNYIMVSDEPTDNHYTLAYITDDSPATVNIIDQNITGDILSATPLGNILTLQIQGDSGTPVTNYAIWADGTYAFQGDTIPIPEIQFQLSNQYVQTSKRAGESHVVIEPGNFTQTSKFDKNIPLVGDNNRNSQTGVFKGDKSFIFRKAGNDWLQANKVYRIDCRRVSGKVLQTITIYLGYTSGSTTTEKQMGVGSVRLWDDDLTQPYAVFTTDADAPSADYIKVRFSPTNSDKSVEYNVILTEGNTATANGQIVKDCIENFNAVLGNANDFVARYATKKELFMYPFFVRYALRMYDGSLVCPSAPCLMLPNVGLTPFIWTKGLPSSSSTGAEVDIIIESVVSRLQYRIVNSPDFTGWENLITGIVIGVSEPIYSYNQGEEWTEGAGQLRLDLIDFSTTTTDNTDGNMDNDAVFGVDNAEGNTWSYGYFDDGDGICSHTYLFRKNNSANEPYYLLRLPQFEKGQVAEKVKTRANFYIINETDISELPTNHSWNAVPIESGTLDSLTARATIDDNPLTLSARGGNAVSIYNSRLVLSDIFESKFKGYMPLTMQGRSVRLYNSRGDIRPSYTLDWVKAIVNYEEEGELNKLCRVDLTDYANSGPILWFYYPSTNATSAILWQKKASQNQYRRAYIELTPHKLLNGAIWFGNFEEPDWEDWQTYDEWGRSRHPYAQWEINLAEHSATVNYPNKLQQSDAYNPYVFTPVRTNLIGDGQILALAAAVRALSQGQFGAFPLYAFTTEGVWSLSVGNEGQFTAIQPVTRDVCNNPRSICQTDQTVIFAAERGLMELAGSATKCISENLHALQPFQITDLPDHSKLNTLLSTDISPLSPTPPFKDFIRGAYVLYLYPLQRIAVVNPAYRLAYLYSLTSQKWGAMHTDLQYTVNSYPETLAVNADNQLVCMSQNDTTATDIPGMLITRPIKLGEPDTLKTISAVIQRGYFRIHNTTTPHIRQVLYASRDLFNWERVASSADHYLRRFSGTPYKYFRLAVLTNLMPDESLSGVSIELQIKQTDQLR